jgi:hypothetical protein
LGEHASVIPPLLPEDWRLEFGENGVIAVSPKGGRITLWSSAEFSRLRQEFQAIEQAEKGD